MKTCSKCKIEKSLNEFNKNKAKKDGHSYYCKPCEHETRRQSPAVKNDKAKARYKRYLQSDKGKQTRRAYYQKRKALGTWKTYAVDLEAHRLYMLKRRAKLANNGIFQISKKDLQRFNNAKCFYCNEAGTTIDHIIPVSRGGAHSIGNLLPCCKPCNSSKGNKTITEWKKTLRYSSLTHTT